MPIPGRDQAAGAGVPQLVMRSEVAVNGIRGECNLLSAGFEMPVGNHHAVPETSEGAPGCIDDQLQRNRIRGTAVFEFDQPAGIQLVLRDSRGGDGNLIFFLWGGNFPPIAMNDVDAVSRIDEDPGDRRRCVCFKPVVKDRAECEGDDTEPVAFSASQFIG